jgi:uroporphyrinogen-III synthase
MASAQRHARLDRLMVTRPVPQADRWVQALNAAGWPAQALPLISIGQPRSPESLHTLDSARAQWAQWDALMFVSSAAVTHFFASGCHPATGPTRTRFWAPGPGTGRALAQALHGLGLSAERIDAPPLEAAQFDSEALWPVVQDQMGPGKRLLVVRGDSSGTETPAPEPPLTGHGREWLIQQCEALGAQAQACVAYERSAPVWSALLRAQAAAAAAPGSLWLLSSSEALAHLCAGLPELKWSQSAALTTHPRIAHAALEAGFGDVQTARPALPDLLRALESHWSPP